MPCGFGASVVLEVGSFFSAVCGRCPLLAGLSFFFDALLASFLDGFAGGRIGVTSGKSSANAPRPPGVFPMSNHRDMTLADFGKLIAEETEKWAKVIRAAHIKAE